MELELYQIWIIVGLLLIVAEIFVPGFVIIWFGVGAFVASLLAFFHASTNWQMFAFAVSSLSLAVMAHTIFKSVFTYGSKSSRKSNVAALVGQEVKVIEKINSSLDHGIVMLNGNRWRAFLANDSFPSQPEGAIVVIEKVDGTKLIVSPKQVEKIADEADEANDKRDSE